MPATAPDRLERLYELLDWLGDEVPTPQPDWEAIAAAGGELAALASELSNT